MAKRMNLPACIRYCFFIARRNFRNTRVQLRERLIKSRIFYIISRKVLPQLGHYSPTMCTSLLANAAEENDFSLIRGHLQRTMHTISNSKNVTLAIEHALHANEKDIALQIYDSAIRRNIRLKRSEEKIIGLAKGDLNMYMKAYANTPKKKWIKKYMPEKYVDYNKIDDVLYGEEKIAIISTLGPGDEIAFSTTYGALLNDPKIDPSRFSILCDYRLYPLLKRSYPALHFVPSRRSRYITRTNPWHLYDKLPTFGMHVLMCNESFEQMSSCDKFIYMHDLIYKYCEKIIDRSETGIYVVDSEKSENYKNFIDDNLMNIGIIWRSTEISSKRNLYYLSVKDLSPLFEAQNARFINLQYSITNEEIDFLRSNLGDRFIMIDDLDLYNDFDSAAALIDCLDLVISPATMMGELAAHTGKTVLLIANTLQVSLRRMPDGSDVWHPNLLHVQGDRLHDRPSLVRNLAQQLRDMAG